MSGSNLIAQFGACVRSLWFQLGITQEELAERADMHRTYIAGIERGARNVTLKSFDKLARALGISVAALLSRIRGAALEAYDTRREMPAGNLPDILLVIDNREDEALILRAFKRSKITNRIHIVHEGEEALDFLFCRAKHADRKIEDRPQLVVLDLKLPKIGALEVVRSIKRDDRTNMIPVVVLARSHRDRDVRECRRQGAETYIVKTVSFFNFIIITPRLNLRWTLREVSPAKPVTRSGNRS